MTNPHETALRLYHADSVEAIEQALVAAYTEGAKAARQMAARVADRLDEDIWTAIHIRALALPTPGDVTK